MRRTKQTAVAVAAPKAASRTKPKPAPAKAAARKVAMATPPVVARKAAKAKPAPIAARKPAKKPAPVARKAAKPAASAPVRKSKPATATKPAKGKTPAKAAKSAALRKTAAKPAAPSARKVAARKPAPKPAAAPRKATARKPVAKVATNPAHRPAKRKAAKPVPEVNSKVIATIIPARKITIETPSMEALRLKAATERLAARRDRDRMPLRIETRRLVLRAPMRGDVPALVTLADNRNIADMLSRLPSPYTRADGIAFVEIFAQRADERPYSIILEGVLVGVVGLTFNPGQPPELGYWLGEPFWGRGVMSEAVTGLLEAAAATGTISTISARAQARNAASLNVLEKAGFRRVGESVEDRGPGAGQPLVALLRELRG